jgi:hypothetical protein
MITTTQQTTGTTTTPTIAQCKQKDAPFDVKSILEDLSVANVDYDAEHYQQQGHSNGPKKKNNKEKKLALMMWRWVIDVL